MAILHDKLEMYTGDTNPVGRDGTGSTTHAFDERARLIKSEKERHALVQYLSALSPATAESQVTLFLEMIEGVSEECRFIKAIDKLQALAFVHVQKKTRRSPGLTRQIYFAIQPQMLRVLSLSQ